MKVAIIGAGASGLTAIKCCLDEGIEPVCYERTDEIGGLWNYKEEIRPGQGSVMKSTIINTSKEIMTYSDFPIPKEYPVYMHNKYVQRYFNLYADKFELRKHIHFQKEIISVAKRSDFATSGQWDVKIKDTTDGSAEELVYDAVLVCTGHHADVHMPTFPGLDKFKGKVLHSHDYKHLQGYEDKEVLIVGIGNSAGDAAVELSRVTSQVYLSTRRGSWVMNRIGDKGQPLDMVISRFINAIDSRLPGLANPFMEHNLNKRFDHAAYSLKPAHRVNSQHPMVNDDLPNRIASGTIQIKADVAEFTENGVKFVDGTSVEKIDVVILATGYKFGFPFIDKSIIEVKDNQVELFKYEFPPELEKYTLAVIGFIQPIGAIMPICELQCRLATRVFKGLNTLPSKSEMWADIQEKRDAMARQYVKSQRHTIQVKYVPFMTELADLVGCNLDFTKLWLTDPKLAFHCYFGPFTPYQFRLQGPGQWKGAREAIFTQWDRTMGSMKTRPLPEEPSSKGQFGFLVFLVTLVSIFMLVLSRFMEN